MQLMDLREREKKRPSFFVFFPRFFLCLCLPVSVCLSLSVCLCLSVCLSLYLCGFQSLFFFPSPSSFIYLHGLHVPVFFSLFPLSVCVHLPFSLFPCACLLIFCNPKTNFERNARRNQDTENKQRKGQQHSRPNNGRVGSGCDDNDFRLSVV